MVYVDSSRPDLVDGFTRKTFTAIIEGIREPAIAARLIERETFDAGVRDLHRTTEADGVFCYTFFKGVAAEAATGLLDPLHPRHLQQFREPSGVEPTGHGVGDGGGRKRGGSAQTLRPGPPFEHSGDEGGDDSVPGAHRVA
jgi:hypothetical protein